MSPDDRQSSDADPVPEGERLRYDALLERDGVQVSRSPWGPEDEIGRMNWITRESQRAILEGLDGSAVFDLGIEYFFGMPSWTAAQDPKYEIWMTHTPQGSVVGPWMQFRHAARIFAIDVLPVPREPTNR